MKRPLLIITALLSIHLFTKAQLSQGILDNGVIRFNSSSTGQLFNRFNGFDLPGFEAPSGSYLTTIAASGLWIGGISFDQTLKFAGEIHGEGQDWYPGPLTNDGSASTDQATMAAWDHVWIAHLEDIINHQLYFDAINAGEPDPFNGGYSIPEYFYDWPAHGDVSLGQDFYIAPFIDFNSNGQYDPENGDSPMICGDHAMFFVFNDKGGVHTSSGGEAIGIQVNALLYVFDQAEGSDISNTVFLNYEIINQGSQSLTDTYMGFWTDFDLGFPNDDFVGTNVARGSVYAYNGDTDDESTALFNGYGTDLPIQSMMLMAGPYLDPDFNDNPLYDDAYCDITNSYADAGHGFDDGIIDNERFGLSSSIGFNNDMSPVNGIPSSSQHFYSYLKHVWKNGADVLYGGNGTSGEEVTDTMATYVYPGDSDPLYVGTGDIEVSGWSETAAENLPGDRNSVASAGPFTLEPGDHHVMNVAYVFSRQSEAGQMNHLSFHENREIAVRNYFNEYLVQCQSEELIIGIHENRENLVIYQFPNPTNGLIHLKAATELNGADIRIFSISGSLVYSGKMNGTTKTIDLSEAGRGLYELVVDHGNSRINKRILLH